MLTTIAAQTVYKDLCKCEEIKRENEASNNTVSLAWNSKNKIETNSKSSKLMNVINKNNMVNKKK